MKEHKKIHYEKISVFESNISYVRDKVMTEKSNETYLYERK